MDRKEEMSNEMYPDVGVDQLIWCRKNEPDWPFIDDISSVSIMMSAMDWTPVDAEFVLKL
jgi:hypothetical protein